MCRVDGTRWFVPRGFPPSGFCDHTPFFTCSSPLFLVNWQPDPGAWSDSGWFQRAGLLLTLTLTLTPTPDSSDPDPKRPCPSVRGTRRLVIYLLCDVRTPVPRVEFPFLFFIFSTLEYIFNLYISFFLLKILFFSIFFLT